MLLTSIVIVPSFSWLELTGLAACHLVATILIGFAFRHHRHELWIVWEFVAAVAAWRAGSMGTAVVQATLWDQGNWVSDPLDQWLFAAVRLIQQGGPVVATALYVWAFQQRHGTAALGRLAITLALGGVASGLWCLAMNLTEEWRMVEFDGSHPLHSLAWALWNHDAPSWDAAIGWIIWSAGLFGGTAVSTSADV